MKKKKNILFVCCEMGRGGVSKSLSSLLNCIDYNRYNVDLFLFRKTGLFLDQIPANVNILPEMQTIWDDLKKFRLIDFMKSILTILICRHINDLESRFKLFWKLNSSRYPVPEKEYDVAISYNDGLELYYIVDRVRAIKRIGYNHTQYSNRLTYKPNLDRSYYYKLDYLVTVSDLCADDLGRIFPEIKSKIRVIENIVLKDQLIKMAEEINPYEGVSRDNTKVVCTVAGLYLRKGFDLASAALRNMKAEGKLFKWYILGVGPEELEVKKTIHDAGLDDDCIFMYEQKNPYPFIKHADIFMLTSHAEGKSIAVEEAKLLEKPILITRYSTADNQIIHGISGLIADMNVISVTNELRKMFEDNALAASCSNYLKENCSSNKDENLSKLYLMLDGI